MLRFTGRENSATMVVGVTPGSVETGRPVALNGTLNSVSLKSYMYKVNWDRAIAQYAWHYQIRGCYSPGQRAHLTILIPQIE